MSSVVLAGDTSGTVTLSGPLVAGTNTISVPAATGTMALTTGQIGMKNRIINGAMVIDQRNAGASVTPAANVFTYTLDRWSAYCNQASKFTVQQNAGSVTPPVGFSNYLGAVSSSAYSVTSTDIFALVQWIEGFNTADLAWGTANAKTVTLSFQVYSSLTGTFGGALMNSAQNRSYPFSYSVPIANTWTTVSVTIAGDTTGTWIGATNGKGIGAWFSLGCGSVQSGTANAWAGTQAFQPTGSVSVVGTSGATFYITGVQLEVGTQATTFDYRMYGTELALCQRYYQLVGALTAIGNFYDNTQCNGSYSIPVVMRGTPSLTAKGVLSVTDSQQIFTQTSAAWVALGADQYTVSFRITNLSPALTAFRTYYYNAGNYCALSAEL
jgi:hypothetical protein